MICYDQQVPTKIFTWHNLHVPTKFEGYDFLCSHEGYKKFWCCENGNKNKNCQIISSYSITVVPNQAF